MNETTPQFVRRTRAPRQTGQSPVGEAIQWVMAAVAASALPTGRFGQPVGRTTTAAGGRRHSLVAPRLPAMAPIPNLVKYLQARRCWPLTFTETQRKAAAVLADVILPKDIRPCRQRAGRAGDDRRVGVGPLPARRATARRPRRAELDRRRVRQAVREALRGSAGGAKADDLRRHLLSRAAAKPEFKKARGLFQPVPFPVRAAYYATPAGWQAIGYVGNVPLTRFEGPAGERAEKAGRDSDRRVGQRLNLRRSLRSS